MAPGRGGVWGWVRGCVVMAAVGLSLGACSSPPPAPTNAYRQAALTANTAAARSLSRGDLTQAKAQAERALASAQALDDPELSGAILLNLARIDGQRGDLRAASRRLDRILQSMPPPGPLLTAQASTRRALLFIDQGDLTAAGDWSGRARVACPTPCPMQATLDNIDAFLALERADSSTAQRLAGRAATAASDARQPNERANALRLQGRAWMHDSRFDEAASPLSEALEIDRQLGLPDRIGLDLELLADTERGRARSEAELGYLQRALTVYQAAGNQASMARVRARLNALAP